MGRTREAIELLVDIVDSFPGVQAIRYDIAVYAAQTELTEEATEWLRIVFANDADAAFAKRALDDPLLDPIWLKRQKDPDQQ